MKLNTVIPFIKWLLKRIFGKVIRVYKVYDDLIVDNPGIGFIPTFFFSVIFCMVSTFVLVVNDKFFPTGFWFILLGMAVIFGNYVRIILRELYRDFKRERRELFEMLKD